MPGVQRGVHGSSTTTQPGPVRRTPPWLCRGSGEEHKGGEAGEESYGEREANRQAVTSKAEESGGCWEEGGARDGGQHLRGSGGGGAGGSGRGVRQAYPLGPKAPSKQQLPNGCWASALQVSASQPPFPLPLLPGPALYARLAVGQAEALRQQKREEQQRLKADKKLTWNQKAGCP